MGLHRETGEKTAFEQKLRIIAHDLPVFASAGLGFIGIDDKIGGTRRIGLRHEGPFETGRKSRAAAPSEPRGFDLADDPLPVLLDKLFRVVPRAARNRALEAPIAKTIKILKDAILVFEHLLRLRIGLCPVRSWDHSCHPRRKARSAW